MTSFRPALQFCESRGINEAKAQSLFYPKVEITRDRGAARWWSIRYERVTGYCTVVPSNNSGAEYTDLRQNESAGSDGTQIQPAPSSGYDYKIPFRLHSATTICATYGEPNRAPLRARPPRSSRNGDRTFAARGGVVTIGGTPFAILASTATRSTATQLFRSRRRAPSGMGACRPRRYCISQ